jgi:hypothetical protein
MVKKGHINSASYDRRPLETEIPLSEKDEQARCIERMRKMQSEALKLWRSLKDKRK